MKQSDVYAWTGDVLAALRGALDAQEFVEILPAILSSRFEPGARHTVAVMGDRALPRVTNGGGATRDQVTVVGRESYYLPVSHCVEKQLALEHVMKVYCMAPCVRLLMDGEDRTGRHLYSFFQTEIEWRTESEDEVYTVIESLLGDFAARLLERVGRTDRCDDDTRARISTLAMGPFERIPFDAARRLVSRSGGSLNPHSAGDMTHAEERALSESHQAPFWITEYPDGVRDSLYRRTPSGKFATYDLILPGGHGELATGGLRPDSADDIRRQAQKFSDSPHEYYPSWKARTKLQTGGLGFGLERLIRYCAGASSILDIRFAHDHGPNATIEARNA